MNTLVTTTSTHLPLAETTHPRFLGTTVVLDVKHILRDDGFMLIVFLLYCKNKQVDYTTIYHDILDLDAGSNVFISYLAQM